MKKSVKILRISDRWDLQPILKLSTKANSKNRVWNNKKGGKENDR